MHQERVKTPINFFSPRDTLCRMTYDKKLKFRDRNYEIFSVSRSFPTFDMSAGFPRKERYQVTALLEERQCVTRNWGKHMII